jgi:hypothetical protein
MHRPKPEVFCSYGSSTLQGRRSGVYASHFLARAGSGDTAVEGRVWAVARKDLDKRKDRVTRFA